MNTKEKRQAALKMLKSMAKGLDRFYYVGLGITLAYILLSGKTFFGVPFGSQDIQTDFTCMWALGKFWKWWLLGYVVAKEIWRSVQSHPALKKGDVDGIVVRSKRGEIVFYVVMSIFFGFPLAVSILGSSRLDHGQLKEFYSLYIGMGVWLMIIFGIGAVMRLSSPGIRKLFDVVLLDFPVGDDGE